MNSLLARQLRKYLPHVAAEEEPWKSFLAAVGNAYAELQQDRDHMERTLEIASQELNEANEKLRHESARKIEDLSAYFRQTLELQEGMILCYRREDNGFVHTLCRGQLAQRLGWTAERVENAGLAAFVLPEELPFLEEIYLRAWSGEACSVEHRVGDITFLALFRPRRDEQSVTEVIVSCVEISALKKFERDLMKAKEKAESADKAKSEFLAVMSHEIRTPLNAILGFTELLMESELSAQQQVWLKTVAGSGESLRELIEDILDFSKIEAGMVELRPQRVIVADLLRSVTTMLGPRAVAKGIELTVDLPANLPSTIVADAARLKQILINLAGNAVKFTQNGRVQIRVQMLPEQAGEPATDSVNLRFSVMDTGIGISEEKRERMFKPFSQADSSSTRVYGGTGLGLAICKKLVEMMGGAIDFSSEFGKGTTFFFNLLAQIPEEIRQEATPPPVATSTIKGLDVLVAEDRSANQQLLREILGRFECHSEFAENGRIAVEMAAHKNYDLIIMDLQMPEMDGFDATRLIRSNPINGRQPRIVALTASTLSEQHRKCRDVGMDSVLTKPLRFDALRAELEKSVAYPVR